MASTTTARSLPAPYDSVTVDINFERDFEHVTLEYRGPARDLIAAGVATSELLGPWKRGKTRIDADGDRALLVRRRHSVELRLCGKSIARARMLPGVTEDSLQVDRGRFEKIRDATASDSEEPLHSLALALERRYPGVKVEAWLRWCDGKCFRTIRFDGSPPLIEGYGLAPGGLDHKGYFIDETGTEVAARSTAESAYAIHHHAVQTGATEGRLRSQHPDNAKTVEAVRRILKAARSTGSPSFHASTYR